MLNMRFFFAFSAALILHGITFGLGFLANESRFSSIKQTAKQDVIELLLVESRPTELHAKPSQHSTQTLSTDEAAKNLGHAGAMPKIPAAMELKNSSSLAPRDHSSYSEMTMPLPQTETRSFIREAYLNTNELDVSPQPVQELMLKYESLSDDRVHSLMLRVYISSDGAVDFFEILGGSLTAEQLTTVLQDFSRTAFIPGQLNSQKRASVMNLEIEIDTFSGLFPRMPFNSLR
jgi:hypothetical protein